MSKRVAWLCAVLTVLTVPTLPGQSPEQPKETAVQRKVREAKEQGLNRIESSLIVDYSVLRSIDIAAQLHDFVIAKPIQMITRVDEVDATSRTIYKLRLEKFVLQQQDRSSSLPFRGPRKPTASFDIPSDFLPWAPKEFLVSTFGGTATIDGIEFVSAGPNEPRFQLGESYLLILNFADLEDRVAGLPMAAHCAWRIQGDELIPLIPATRNPLARDVVALFRGSLRRLEFALPLRDKTVSK